VISIAQAVTPLPRVACRPLKRWETGGNVTGPSEYTRAKALLDAGRETPHFSKCLGSARRRSHRAGL